MVDGQRTGALRALAVVSGVYDLALAVSMLFFAPALAAAVGAPPPVPLLNAQLNGVFTLTLAAGYFWAARDVDARRGYLWIAGVLAKGLGAALFVLDHFVQGSPRTFLLFALSDGSLAVVTLVLLLISGGALTHRQAGVRTAATGGVRGCDPP
jgi:hypothetical protein